jgi:3-hydroxyisobutyrate dehydrogenase-like beta-hydroxyacid dehydrogenase
MTAGAPLAVGFIGVGQMGRPMVDRLAAGGWSPEVFVRRPELRTELETAGVPVAATAVELAGRVDLLIVCLFKDDQVRALLFDDGVLAAMRPGAVLVNHVTGSPSLAVELQAAAPAGVTVLDVPISGTANSIRAGELTLLAAGDGDALAKVRPALESYGHPVIEIGGLGDAQRMKLINNLMFTAQLRIAVEAAALGASLGVAPTELARVIAECSGDSFALRLFQHMAPEAMAAGAKPYLVKDVAVIREIAQAEGIDLGVLGELASWVDQ